ncbi:hypothetical protein V5P93_004233 [Actinokineospora auranticolor]|uniref:DUF1449 family protein n=1 Tax=Actinokineospora auranticolor TaxID=155976 RepID=A0A2S6GIG3_9PSEU|nr:hypothetical protein [Actinokineospora auranticolor]PPK65022.1 hypothetical protein CLV40_11665 [Actinokineospora auranticolor]
MGEFVGAALSFPAVLFSFLLVVVVGYWLLVLVGLSEIDLPGAPDPDGIGLGGVPLTVAVSVVTVVAWFLALVSGVLLDDLGLAGALLVIARAVALVVVLVVALLVTRLVVIPLRKAFPEDAGPKRADFVGLVCVVRTGSVDRTFGQAEVTSVDGSSAVIQVRQPGVEPLRAGSTAVIHDYDPVGEFFWITPVDLTPLADPRDQPRPRD